MMGRREDAMTHQHHENASCFILLESWVVIGDAPRLALSPSSAADETGTCSSHPFRIFVRVSFFR
jgi:hypothetical protein